MPNQPQLPTLFAPDRTKNDLLILAARRRRDVESIRQTPAEPTDPEIQPASAAARSPAPPWSALHD